jgi:predicted 3-demethylubiquinone-9 3-methyltransferase (glyoxalase superfamily)
MSSAGPGRLPSTIERKGLSMKAITPCLWFDDRIEEAVEFYTSTLPGGKVHGYQRMPDGGVITADFEIAGLPMKALNGGPQFRFTEAISLFVECDDQAEVDHFWSALSADGGEEGQCGWLKDRYGLSWQIVPVEFLEIMGRSEGAQLQRVMDVMMGMRKLEVAPLRAAAQG